MLATRAFGPLRVHSCAGGDGVFLPSGHPLLLAVVRGPGALRRRGRALAAPPGSLCFLPGDAALAFSGFADGDLVLVELPAEVAARGRESLAGLASRAISTDAGAPAFLRSFVDTLDRQSGYDPDYPAWVQICVCEMAERVLAECAEPRPTAAQRAVGAAKTYVLAHLTDTDLGPPQVARAAAVSLRTLNRLFAAEGHSVGGWIRDQRLRRCRDDLLDPRKAERSIGQIGATWGFLDAAHFSRAFKDAFGCSPRALRARPDTRVA